MFRPRLSPRGLNKEPGGPRDENAAAPANANYRMSPVTVKFPHCDFGKIRLYSTARIGVVEQYAQCCC